MEHCVYVAHLRQECHNSKFMIFQEKCLEVLKCYNFLSATTTQLLSNGEFSNCFMTLYLLKCISERLFLYQ